ncbi:MAG: Uma2 family endonuclease [Planctomycetaceae bacterium]|nr:MAG: Uma2 family endonuclease [Planctomycetaceae bacterium]
MSTALLPEMAAGEQRLLLSDIDWETYDQLLSLLEGRHLRLNYDQGTLEIMTTSGEHERLKKLLARLLEVITEELNVPIMGVGNWTLRREDLSRGLEPDECWYVAHEELARTAEELDLNEIPPPDLVVEIEVSRSVVNRLALLAALGVPEVWRYDGRQLVVLRLESGGRYAERDHSPTFPQIPLPSIVDHLKLRGATDETTIVRSFRRWLQGRLDAGAET